MSRQRLAALALAATTLAASGCGGTTKTTSQTASPAQAASTTATTSTSSASTQPLTQAQFVAKADAICRRVDAKRSATQIKTLQDYVRVVPALAAYELAAVTEMQKLKPPASMASGWNEITTSAQTIAQATATLARYAKANDIAKAPDHISKADDNAARQARAAAQADGLTHCAQRT